MNDTHTYQRLHTLQLALERELIYATDEEILAAASELGMNPAMKGSAAFIGVTMLARPHLGLDETSRGGKEALASRRATGKTPSSD